MKKLISFGATCLILLLASCSTETLPLTELSPSEQNLLAAINELRVSEGKSELRPSRNLTELARKDARRRVDAGSGYVEHRIETGYERMLTLSGRAYANGSEGEQLVGFWQRNPIQQQWLRGSYASVGVGVTSEKGEVLRGVILLGGYSPDGI